MNKKRLITGALVALAIVLTGVAVMFAFGAPQKPVGGGPGTVASPAVAPAPPTGAAPGSADDGETSASPGTSLADTRTPEGDDVVPAPDPSSPFAIEIPGCVCHSDDPKIVQEHSEYRMNQCFGCHAGGMPKMGD